MNCWRWTGTHRKEDGRPLDGRKYAYRTLYEAARGPLPKGAVLHHKCGHRWCVNPWHLEPMHQGDHLREHGLPGDWGQRDKTHCPAGHPYDEANTYHWRNERHCRACRTATKARYNARRKKTA